MKPSIAVVILTYNESMHIGRALDSVSAIASEVFVIDSGSSDDTTEVARSHGATVLIHPFVNQAQQFQWALDNCSISSKWLMRLDADEFIEPTLAEEIKAKLPSIPQEVAGINLKRKHIFMGRWVRYGGRYPLRLLRIWRNGQGRVENRWMDEHVVVWGGSIIDFAGDFADHNLNNLSYFIDKHNNYATREAIDVLNRKYGLFQKEQGSIAESTSLQAKVKRFIKERIYNRIPFTISSTLYFVWRYIFQLGFLDGRTGLVYHFLQGWWYRFLVGAKLMELESALIGIDSNEQRLAVLSQLTGYSLPTKENR